MESCLHPAKAAPTPTSTVRKGGHFRGESYDNFQVGGEDQDEESSMTPSSSATSLTPESILYPQQQQQQQQEESPLAETEDDDDHELQRQQSQLMPLVSPLRNAARSTFNSGNSFEPIWYSSRMLEKVSRHMRHSDSVATWIGFWAFFLVTCANFVLTPMRDAIALAVGVAHIPKLTLASTLLAVISSVPIGWLFEAPDPMRRKLWKRMGLTRGETQGTSLALFYRFFAMSLLSYAIGFKFMAVSPGVKGEVWSLLQTMANVIYVAFFLVVHLMKLHSLSLLWGVTTEAMEYEEVARKRMNHTIVGGSSSGTGSKTRLQHMAYVGFGGTLGGILGRYVYFHVKQSNVVDTFII